MIREKLIDKGIGDNKKFRWRSHEISRTEGLSDAVFGFAITLLVVSLEVPKTFGELMQTMRGFGAFAISFTLLFMVWFNQYKFFRRYGLAGQSHGLPQCGTAVCCSVLRLSAEVSLHLSGQPVYERGRPRSSAGWR